MIIKQILATFLVMLYSLSSYIFCQDTFSIVAVDPETGAVGGAGASCIDDADCNGCGGVIIINGLLPGRGAMNSQAYACIPNVNLNLGLAQMEQGANPLEVLDYVIANDQCFFQNSNWRQYGVVDFDSTGNPRSAAFTGSNCDSYANHITGPNYAIQGNILLGQEILDGMEAGFVNTNGTLAEKLMAALQGANVPGADTRCLLEGVSSKSAFLRVAMPDDTDGNYFLELNVKSTPYGEEPIDSLQTLFDQWLVTSQTDIKADIKIISVYPNPASEQIVFEISKGIEWKGVSLQLYTPSGKMLSRHALSSPILTLSAENLQSPGLYAYHLVDATGKIQSSGKFIYQP